MYLGHSGVCGFCGNDVRQGFDTCGHCQAKWTDGSIINHSGRWRGGKIIGLLRFISWSGLLLSLLVVQISGCEHSFQHNQMIRLADYGAGSFAFPYLGSSIIGIVLLRLLFFKREPHQSVLAGKWQRWERRNY
jgi:hypothetical protein